MRTLIIPDVHQRIDRVKNIVKSEKFDLLVSLGDWFDNFHDTPKDAEATAEYILELYSELKDNFIWLLGNHDVGYVFPLVFGAYRCSGMTLPKMKVISEVFKGRLDKDKLKLCYVNKTHNTPLVMSHAGLAKQLFTHPLENEVRVDYIEEKCNQALLDCVQGKEHPILMAGKSRGGSEDYGGITWQDWFHDFKPVQGISQIVGHTPFHYPILTWKPNPIRPSDRLLDAGVVYCINDYEKFNLNLDTHSNHYAVLDDNTLEIYDYTKKFQT
jgi:hypothetical protein